MLKNILKLQGAKQLAKNEQQHINGGEHSGSMKTCSKHADCPPGFCCNHPNHGGCTPSGPNQRYCR